MTGQDNGSARQAVARLVAELGRAKRAIERGDLTDAREALAAVRALDPGNLQAQALEERCRAGGTFTAPAAAPVSAAFMEQPAWLSFEQRVRERRARHCERAAEAAIAAGAAGDAIAAIDELELVLPSHPRIAELRQRAASPVHVDPVPGALAHGVGVPDTPPEPLLLQDPWSGISSLVGGDLAAGDARAGQSAHTASRRSGFAGLLGALAVLCVAFAAGSWWWVNRDVSAPDGLPIDSPRTTAPAPHDEQVRVPAPMPAQPEPAPVEPAMSGDTADVASVDTESHAPPVPVPSDVPIESAARHPSADREPLPRESVSAAAAGGSLAAPPSQTSTRSDTPATPLASVAAPIGTAGNTATAAAPLSPAGTIQPLAESLPPRPAPAPPPAAAAAVNTTATMVDPAAHLVAGVRQVLDTYAQGYSSKQAAVVRQVWPEVDARALERAFGQLDSQVVRFDECRIEAAETSASATCTGMASWVPAVGDRSPRRQPRTWRFALAREGRGWIITQARVAAK